MDTVYRTEHPDVLAYVEAQRAARKVWGVKIEAFMAAHLPEGTKVAGNSGWGGHNVAGFRLPEDAKRVPGFVGSKYGVHYPNEKSTVGKRLARELEPLATIPYPLSGLPGMPSFAMVGNGIYNHGAALDGNTVWVKWAFDIEAAADIEEAERAAAKLVGRTVSRNVERPDATIWSRVPLSAFYAMVEAGADPFAAKTIAVI